MSVDAHAVALELPHVGRVRGAASEGAVAAQQRSQEWPTMGVATMCWHWEGHWRGLRRRMYRPVAGEIQRRFEIVVCAVALASVVACRCDREICMDV